MTTQIDRIVARYAAGESVKLGSAKEFPAARLQEELTEVLQRNCVYFNVLFGALIGLMVLIVLLLIFFVRDQQIAAGILAISGISLPFIIRLLVQMWQAKTQAEVLITLCAHLDSATMRSIVKALTQGMAIKAAAR